MKVKKIQAIIQEKTGELSVLSSKIDGDFDNDTIHKFRVAVKTLRSFLRLIRMQTQKNSLKMPERFKRLYHIAGAIRDAQLEMELIAGKEHELPRYTDKLQHMLAGQKKEWHRHYSKKVLHKLENRLLGFNYDALDTAVLSAFFESRLALIDELGKIKSPTDRQVHNIRKQAKEILYTAELTRKKWKEARQPVADIPLKQLSGLADEIGDYNDKRIALEHLNSFSSSTMQHKEAHNIKTIYTKNSRQLKTTKKKIITAVKGLSYHSAVKKDAV